MLFLRCKGLKFPAVEELDEDDLTYDDNERDDEEDGDWEEIDEEEDFDLIQLRTGNWGGSFPQQRQFEQRHFDFDLFSLLFLSFRGECVCFRGSILLKLTGIHASLWLEEMDPELELLDLVELFEDRSMM